jgi:hypothetical protein
MLRAFILTLNTTFVATDILESSNADTNLKPVDELNHTLPEDGA